MNEQFLSSFKFNKATFTNFLQEISPEEFQRIINPIVPPFSFQTIVQSAPSDMSQQITEFQPQTEKTEPIKTISLLNQVKHLQKAEYTGELGIELNDVKTELNSKLENRIVWAKQEAMVKFEGFGHFPESTSKSEMTFPQQEDAVDKLSMSTLTKPLNLSDYLRGELEKMVSFILHNMGKIRQNEIENQRNHYLNNKCLLQIYDKLVMKYFSAKRCREDIVRYILRRAFREVRTPIMKEEKLTTKQASIAVCKKYFHTTFEELERSGREIKGEEDLFELLMPYTKKSKNKTMNTTFVQEVFASQKFSEDYQIFLGEFDRILAEDNNKKIEQLLEFLMDCIKKDALDKIAQYKRFPWLDTWIKQTKDIATSLPKHKQTRRHNYKKTKI